MGFIIFNIKMIGLIGWNEILQKKLLIVTEIFTIYVNDFNAKKSTRDLV